MAEMLTSKSFLESIDNPDVRRARIERLLTSAGALADLVSAEEAAEIHQAVVACQAAADDAEAADDRAAAYRAMDQSVDELTTWLSAMVAKPGWTRGLTRGPHTAYIACKTALEAAGEAQDEYTYRELGEKAQLAANGFADACRYAVGLPVYDRLAVSGHAQDLVLASIAAWRRAADALGHRVLRYRRDEYEAGRNAIWSAQSVCGKLVSEISNANYADNVRPHAGD